MPNTSLSNAIKEAMAVAPTSKVILHTIQLTHPIAGDRYLIADTVDRTLTLETGATQLFTAIGFRFSFPTQGTNGVQELPITIDNVDRMASDYVEAAIGSPDSVEVIYRPYLSDDLTTPQMDPPLQMTLKNVKINAFQVTGTASFADVLNKTFLKETYNETRFPGLA